MLLCALMYSVHQQLYAGMNTGIEICSAANLCQHLHFTECNMRCMVSVRAQ